MLVLKHNDVCGNFRPYIFRGVATPILACAIILCTTFLSAAGDIPTKSSSNEILIGLQFLSHCDDKTFRCVDVSDTRAPPIGEIITHSAAEAGVFNFVAELCRPSKSSKIGAIELPTNRIIANAAGLSSLFQKRGDKAEIIELIRLLSRGTEIKIENALIEVADDDDLIKALKVTDHACLKSIAKRHGDLNIIFSRLHGIVHVRLKLNMDLSKSQLESGISRLYSNLRDEYDFSIDRAADVLQITPKDRVVFAIRAKPLASLMKSLPQLFE